jgi:hypothetical protein
LLPLLHLLLLPLLLQQELLLLHHRIFCWRTSRRPLPIQPSPTWPRISPSSLRVWWPRPLSSEYRRRPWPSSISHLKHRNTASHSAYINIYIQDILDKQLYIFPYKPQRLYKYITMLTKLVTSTAIKIYCKYDLNDRTLHIKSSHFGSEHGGLE